MALHGLAEITVGVPDADATAAFYRDFGLTEASTGTTLGTIAGGEQLRLVKRPYRQLVEVVVAAEDQDDIERIRRAAGERAVADGDDVVVHEPLSGTAFRIAIRERVGLKANEPGPYNSLGSVTRTTERSDAIYRHGPSAPHRLGHVLFATPDVDASRDFFTSVLGFKLSDEVPGVIAFVRCSSDHHNVGLMHAPVPFFHHSSWEVEDIDAIGSGAQHLLAIDAKRNVWGLGRHFLGSNLFWYFRDPAGNYAEYFTDLDQIVDDEVWVARTWEPDKALYTWGPPVPPEFLNPSDLDAIAAAREGDALAATTTAAR